MIGRCCKGVMAWELESGLLHRFRAHHTVNSFFVDNENLSYNGIFFLESLARNIFITSLQKFEALELELSFIGF